MLSSQVAERKERLQIAENQFSEIERLDKKIQNTLREVRRRTKQFPDKLRGNLSRIKAETSSSISRDYSRSPIQQHPPSSNRLLPNDIKTLEKGVQWYTKKWFSGIVDQLERGVIIPLATLEVLPKKHQKIERLSKKALDDIFGYINKLEQKHPNFWRTYSGKGSVANELDNVVNTSFQPIYREIQISMTKVKQVMEDNKKAFLSLQKRMDEIKVLKNELEGQLKTLQSPIGKIPVKLTDSIKIFPLLLAFLMVMMTLHWSKSRYLYLALQKNKSKMESTEERDAFDYLIKCWYLPPYQTILHQIILIFSMSLLVVTYLRVVYLVRENPELFLSLSQKANTLQLTIYMALYGLGALIIVGCLWSILRGKSHL